MNTLLILRWQETIQLLVYTYFEQIPVLQIMLQSPKIQVLLILCTQHAWFKVYLRGLELVLL